ncbi:MAG: DEAD/DEAH box helicase [Burkholderiales bacterium]|nr:DEAD/DEAH box helicase [Burkholderiales bacterium]
MTTFADLSLIPELQRAIADQGYTAPTPIQAQAIPVVLAGRDVMGGAQTGTGKTAAFALPILQRLAPHANTSMSPARHPVRALILTPTRELAAQVEESFRAYGKYLPLRTTVVFGGVPMDPQTAALRSGVEILVATPGRLLDHAQQKMLNLQQVEVFVLDEADRMLDMGFIPDVKRIIAMLPPKRQNLLFSATFPDEIRKLCASLLSNPVTVQVAPKHATADLVEHRVYPVPRERKRDLLVHLIRSRDIRQVLVFCATRLGANRLAYQLNRDGVHAAAIHGDKSQQERIEALEAFKAGKVGVLVATDVAARGLDIEDLPFVVNFELPNTPEDYVHRIGRTGRAGKTGQAVSLVSPDEHEKLAEIEKTIRKEIPREIVAGFGPDAARASSLMPERTERRRDRRDREAPRLTGGAAAPAKPSPKPPAKPADPIFSQPYQAAEPGAPAGAKPVEPRKRERQVAALLGGLRRQE